MCECARGTTKFDRKYKSLFFRNVFFRMFLFFSNWNYFAAIAHRKQNNTQTHSDQGPDKGVGGNAPGRHFWWKEGRANGLSRMNLKFGLGFTFWLRLDLPYVWPGLSQFKRLSRCPIPVSKMSRDFASVKFSKFTFKAWWCIVMK